MKVLIKSVSIEEKPQLSKMLNQYLDELSQYANDQLPKPYKFLDAYFTEPNRRPFFITVDGKNAGIILVNLKDPLSNGLKQAISEFYVLPEFRKHGIGSEAAEQIFDLFPGTWVIRELEGNPAEDFWKKVIENNTKGKYKEYEEEDKMRKRKVQEFTNSER